MRRFLGVLSLALILAASVELVHPVSKSIAREHGAEVRLAARSNGNGFVSVGLQHRLDGRWQWTTPARNILPASAAFDRWHTTSSVAIETAQARVEIGVRNPAWSDIDGPDQFIVGFGEARYRARCGRLILSLADDGLEMQTGSRDCQEVVTVLPTELTDPVDVGDQVLRIAARRLSGGGVELGLQRLRAGQWETLRQPARPVLTSLSRNVWRFTSTFDLPALPAHVFGELRRGASITTRDGEFDLEVDGRVFRSRCGLLDLSILTEHVLVDTATETCNDTAPLLTICPTADCDVQQNAVYAWESRQIGDSLDQIRVTRSEAQAVVNAIYADFYPRGNAPTVSFASDQLHGHADRYEIVLGTNVRTLGSVVHELAHALLARTTVRDIGHGGPFTAMLLQLWERYFPIADVEAARDDAARQRIDVASRPPLQNRLTEARQVITQLFCDGRQSPARQHMCNSASGAMSQQHDAEIDGQYIGWGGDDELRWGAFDDDETGELRSYVARDSTISQTGSEARLSIQCDDDRLEVNVYWDVGHDLDWTIWYRINIGPVQTEDWISGWGTWGDIEYKWTGREEAGDLVAELAWAAQAGGSFTVQSQTREVPSETFTATFDLDGLFDTPVQPNLAHCGR